MADGELPLNDPNAGKDPPGAATTARPDWLPESYWDATAGAAKGEALTNDLTELGTLRTLKADIDAKAAALPKDAAGYKIELPKDFQVPEGRKFVADDKNPMVAEARGWAAKHGIPQEALTDLIGLYAKSQVNDLTAMAEFEAEEKKALGTNADARIKSVTDWAGGIVGKDKAAILSPLLKTKAGVEAFETIMSKMGGVKINGQPKVDPPANPAMEHRDDIGKPGTGAALLRAANSASH